MIKMIQKFCACPVAGCGIGTRPERPFEYKKVDNLIYRAFSKQHGVKIGKIMRNHFKEERKDNLFARAVAGRGIGNWENSWSGGAL